MPGGGEGGGAAAEDEGVAAVFGLGDEGNLAVAQLVAEGQADAADVHGGQAVEVLMAQAGGCGCGGEGGGAAEQLAAGEFHVSGSLGEGGWWWEEV